MDKGDIPFSLWLRPKLNRFKNKKHISDGRIIPPARIIKRSNMDKKLKTKYYFIAATVLAVICFCVSVFFTSYAFSLENKNVSLGGDLKNYSITKMYTDEDSVIVGTSDGELFAESKEGEHIWSVGKIFGVAVYDITVSDGYVYAAYANGNVVRFSEEAATASTVETLASDKYKVYRTGFTFDGNVRNTQLIVPDGGETFYLRGEFNDRSSKKRIYRFETADETNRAEVVKTSKKIGGAAYYNGTLYYAVSNVVNAYNGTESREIANLDEPVSAVSVVNGNPVVITENSNIINVNEASGQTKTQTLSVELNSSFVFSIGSDFVAKQKSGGVAVIDGEKMSVTFTMHATDNANLIMWTTDGFVLRDESDITNPQIIYYSFDFAKTKSVYQNLTVPFIIANVLLVFVALYFGFGIKGKYRERINAKISSFFVALVKYKLVYISLIIPFALLTIFYYIPIVLGLGLSFFDYLPGVRTVFVGFDNFKAVVTTAEFWQSSLTMLEFLVADLLKAIIPPVILAEAICALRSKKYSLWVRILLFLPGVLPGVATTLVWSSGVFGSTQNSLLNAFIGLFVPGFVKNWVFSTSHAVAVGTLIAFGFPWVGSYLIFFGAIAGINVSYFEAAKLDGCGWFKRIVSIDIPLIFPQIKYIFVTSFIASVQNYTSIFVLHGLNGTIKTPALLMYKEIVNANYGVASVMGVLIFLFLSVATFFNFRMQSDKS